MKLEAGQVYLSDWYQNNNITQREFVFKDFGDFVWTVKQYSEDGGKTVKVNRAYQLNPQDGEMKWRDVDGICNKALRPETDMYKELQFTHSCTCCN